MLISSILAGLLAVSVLANIVIVIKLRAVGADIEKAKLVIAAALALAYIVYQRRK